MPLLVRGGGGGGKKAGGYSTKSVTILEGYGVQNTAFLRWSDPDDTIIDSAVFAKWNGTLIIRKEDSAPKNETDGIVILDSKEKSKYKDVKFQDKTVETGRTYYYGIFPYTEKKVFNYALENIVKVVVTELSPILEENTWEQIGSAVEQGIEKTLWKIGDEKILHIGGTTYAQDIVMQIWGFGVDELSTGEKASITFGSKDLTSQKLTFYDNGTTDWTISNPRKVLNGNDFYGKFPTELKNIIKNTSVLSLCQPTNMYTPKKTSDKLWIPAWSDRKPCMSEYTIFTDDASRKKKSNGIYDSYNTREPGGPYASDGQITCITNDGKQAGGSCEAARPICFGFCI